MNPTDERVSKHICSGYERNSRSFSRRFLTYAVHRPHIHGVDYQQLEQVCVGIAKPSFVYFKDAEENGRHLFRDIESGRFPQAKPANADLLPEILLLAQGK